MRIWRLILIALLGKRQWRKKMRIFFIGDEGGTSTWFSQIRRKEHNYFSARFCETER